MTKGEKLGVFLISTALLIRAAYLSAMLGMALSTAEIVAILLFALGMGCLLCPKQKGE